MLCYFEESLNEFGRLVLAIFDGVRPRIRGLVDVGADAFFAGLWPAAVGYGFLLVFRAKGRGVLFLHSSLLLLWMVAQIQLQKLFLFGGKIGSVAMTPSRKPIANSSNCII